MPSSSPHRPRCHVPQVAHSNRAAAHIKLRNFLSALDDCSRVLDISQFLDSDFEKRPPPPPVLKAYVRRATANLELGRHEEAKADLDGEQSPHISPHISPKISRTSPRERSSQYPLACPKFSVP